MNPTGEVIAAFGRQFLVREHDTRQLFSALVRGRALDIAVGDDVDLATGGHEQRIITRVAPRRSELRRSASHRSKVLAANIDQVALVISPEPHFSEDILLRVSIAASAGELPLLVVANKADHPAFEKLRGRLRVFEALGMRTVELSAREAPHDAQRRMAPLLAGRCTLLCGESGMGKSTLLNLLVPDAAQRTQAISEALNSGKHTTTASRMFDLDTGFVERASVIDSPGFQQFGLAHLSVSQREHAMPDIAGLLGECRFNNCRHGNEPGCAIRAGVAAGEIDALRYRLFMALAD